MAEVYPSIGDENGNEILSGFHIETISADHKADLISAPIEIGEKRFDNKVIQPENVSITGYVQEEDYNSVLVEMLEMYYNREYKFYTILTRSKLIYPNMCLQNMPLKESPDKYDLVYCTLQFQKIITTHVSDRKPSDSADTKSKGTGTKGVR